VYTTTYRGYKTYALMLNHLVDFGENDFVPPIEAHDTHAYKPLERTTPQELIDAQAQTAKWEEELDDFAETPEQEEVIKTAARDAFKSVVTQQTPALIKEKLTKLQVPAAVQHLVGMLSVYDWEFMEQAKELRGYAVAQILEETKHPDAKIRLKALEMLGKVTEVALFTEKIEVKKTELSDSELEQRIKDKLNRFMGVVDVVDVSENDEKTDNANPN
jgi:hypothetical protein